MDKNIAALMRQNCRTVKVIFDAELNGNVILDDKIAKGYTYVSDFPLNKGDLVVVEAAGQLKLATVIKVDDDVDIEPNSNITFKWVITQVDLTHYEESMALNKQITDAVAVAYKNNLRKSFAQQILSGMPDDQRAQLEKLTHG